MYAERIVLETDQSGNMKNVPRLPPNSQVEAIFLVLQQREPEPESVPARRPHPDIAGRVSILGDVMSSAPSSDWNLPT